MQVASGIFHGIPPENIAHITSMCCGWMLIHLHVAMHFPTQTQHKLYACPLLEIK